jgi:O-antigen ligase
MISALAYLLFCLACVVLAFVRHPIYGLYFYFATIFVYPPSRWWGYMVPDLRWALLSAAVAVAAVIFHQGRLAKKPSWFSNGAAIILILYGAWMWVQSPWALDPPEHFDGSTKYLKFLVTFWLVYRVTDSKETLRDIVFAFVAGCTVLGVLAQFAGREGGRLDGVGGPGLDDSNTLGMYLATGVIAAFGIFLAYKGWRKWLSFAMLIVILNGFVLANSRGAFLGLVAGGLVVMLCKAYQHRREFWILTMIAAMGFPLIVDKTFIERMFTIGDVVSDSEDADMSARSRLEIYQAQLRMAADYPLGTGYRGTVVLSRSYLDRRWLSRGNGLDDPDAGRSSHNTLMTALVEQGWPGLLMFLCLLGWIVRAIHRTRGLKRRDIDPQITTLAATCCACLAVVMVAGTATDYLMAELQFWLFACLVSALQLGETAVATKPLPSTTAAMRPLSVMRS